MSEVTVLAEVHPIQLLKGDLLCTADPDNEAQEVTYRIAAQAYKQPSGDEDKPGSVIVAEYVTGGEGEECTGRHIFDDPDVWVTVERTVEVPEAAGEDALTGEIYDRVTVGIAPTDPEYVADEGPEDAAALCVYCEWPIRVTSTGYAHVGEPCGLTPRPIPKSARHDGEPEQVLA